jgi:hypothetical protein
MTNDEGMTKSEWLKARVLRYVRGAVAFALRPNAETPDAGAFTGFTERVAWATAFRHLSIRH